MHEAFSTKETVDSALLHPTHLSSRQPRSRRRWGLTAGSVNLVSSDNYVLDGHHQWLAKRQRRTINIIRLGAPIRQLISLCSRIPKLSDGRKGKNDSGWHDDASATDDGWHSPQQSTVPRCRYSTKHITISTKNARKAGNQTAKLARSLSQVKTSQDQSKAVSKGRN